MSYKIKCTDCGWHGYGSELVTPLNIPDDESTDHDGNCPTCHSSEYIEDDTAKVAEWVKRDIALIKESFVAFVVSINWLMLFVGIIGAVVIAGFATLPFLVEGY